MPILDDTGHMTGMAAIMRDVTARLRGDARPDAEARRSEQAIKSKDGANVDQLSELRDAFGLLENDPGIVGGGGAGWLAVIHDPRV